MYLIYELLHMNSFNFTLKYDDRILKMIIYSFNRIMKNVKKMKIKKENVLHWYSAVNFNNINNKDTKIIYRKGKLTSN